MAWMVLKELWKAVTFGLSWVGVMLTAKSWYETFYSGGHFLDWISFHTAIAVFSAFCAGRFLYAAVSLYCRKHKVSNTTKSICVKPCDLAKQKDGSILVGVNNELTCDTERISHSSLHYQILLKYRAEHGEDWMKERFQKEFEAHAVSAGPGLPRRVPYGYSFEMKSPDRVGENEGQSFVFLVSSQLNQPEAASAPTQSLKEAIDRFFSEPHPYTCRMNRLYMPLLGTGAAANTIDKQRLIDYMAFQFTNKPNNIHELVISFRWRTLRKDLTLTTVHEHLQSITEKCRGDCCVNHSDFLQ